MNEVISAPRIKATFPVGLAIITGNFTVEESTESGRAAARRCLARGDDAS